MDVALNITLSNSRSLFKYPYSENIKTEIISNYHVFFQRNNKYIAFYLIN